ncbi:MAG: T9SS type A sorting domain-containing protein, partial [Bacteroidales bacterium]|nr:T9SS type A sorting domain-containing protein [Bacteroidales bacterium]
DISNPSDPQTSAYYYRSGCFALGATVEGSYVYLADGPAGFQIYDNLIITSTDEYSTITDNDVFIYPNPATHCFNIEFEIPTRAQYNIELLDLTGKKVSECNKSSLTSGKQIVNFDIDDQGILPGIYFVKININEKTQFSKVIVN